MTEDEGVAYTFTDADDARTYLGELRVLWTSWIVALGLLVFVQQFWLFLVVGVLAIGSVVYFSRPLQARADRMVPTDSVVLGKRGRPVGTARDRTLRARCLP